MGTQKGAGARMYYVRRVSEGVVEQVELGGSSKSANQLLFSPLPIFFHFEHPPHPRNEIENKMSTETCLHDTSTGKCYDSISSGLPPAEDSSACLPT